jgi:hypothetical protein
LITPLERECDVFCRTLAGVSAPAAVRADYARAHEVGPLGGAPSFFDRTLVRIGRTTPFCARLADSYAVLFARRSLLRQKLVMLLAILESHGATSRRMDAPRSRSLAAFAIAAPVLVLLFALRTLLAILILAPIHAASRFASPPR